MALPRGGVTGLLASEANTQYSTPITESQQGSFELGPTDQNCLEVWASPETVENAHDLGNRPIYEAPTNNNAQHLTPAPEADR